MDAEPPLHSFETEFVITQLGLTGSLKINSIWGWVNETLSGFLILNEAVGDSVSGGFKGVNIVFEDLFKPLNEFHLYPLSQLFNEITFLI